MVFRIKIGQYFWINKKWGKMDRIAGFTGFTGLALN